MKEWPFGLKISKFTTKLHLPLCENNITVSAYFCDGANKFHLMKSIRKYCIISDLHFCILLESNKLCCSNIVFYLSMMLFGRCD